MGTQTERASISEDKGEGWEAVTPPLNSYINTLAGCPVFHRHRLVRPFLPPLLCVFFFSSLRVLYFAYIVLVFVFLRFVAVENGVFGCSGP